MKSQARESLLVSGMLDALHAQGIFAWRNNTGAYAVTGGSKRRFIRFGAPGSSDIFLIVPRSKGQLGQLEAKTERGNLSAAQVKWCEETERRGCRYGVFLSISEGLAHVAVWTEEACE